MGRATGDEQRTAQPTRISQLLARAHFTGAEGSPHHCGRHVQRTSGAAGHQKRRCDFGKSAAGQIGFHPGRDDGRQLCGEGEQRLSISVPIPFPHPPVLGREPVQLARAAPPPACRYGGAMTPAQAGPPGRRAIHSREFDVTASATIECQKILTCGLRNLFRIGNIIGIRYRLVRHSAEKGSAAEFRRTFKRHFTHDSLPVYLV